MPDFLPLEQALITAAATIVSASAVVVAAYIRSHVRNVEMAAGLDRAVMVGAGVAHDALTSAVAAGGKIDWNAAKAAAIASGTEAAQEIASGVTAEHVTAALAPLLAVDPSVPAGTGSTATATASAGNEALAAVGPSPTAKPSSTAPIAANLG